MVLNQQGGCSCICARDGIPLACSMAVSGTELSTPALFVVCWCFKASNGLERIRLCLGTSQSNFLGPGWKPWLFDSLAYFYGVLAPYKSYMSFISSLEPSQTSGANQTWTFCGWDSVYLWPNLASWMWGWEVKESSWGPLDIKSLLPNKALIG